MAAAAKAVTSATLMHSALQCNIPLPPNPSTYWYEQIEHNGISPFIPNGSSWQVYRNVKDYGATGNGETDDTPAIQTAINYGGRGPGGNGLGTTGAPAVIYFPEGTYLMSQSVQSFVDTFFIGNPIKRPTLKVASNFTGSTLLYMKDPDLDATINFYIGVKNFVLDSTAYDPDTAFTIIDWSVSQATQLTNVLFRMPQSSQHTGVSTPEGGSGTYMGNLDFEGGLYGINMNNQQYSIKSCTFSNTQTGILISHGFDMVFQNPKFSNCEVGVNATSGGVGNVGSVALIDSTAKDVAIVIATKSQTVGNSTTGDDSIVVDNLATSGVGSTVVAGGKTILTGSVPRTWIYGNAYLKGGPVMGVHDAGVTYQTFRSPLLLDGADFFTMAPPTYQEYSVHQVVNIKTVEGYPVYGDGQTDDMYNINAILARNAGCAITFFPAGTYLVSDTIHIPPGSRLVGEALSAISAIGTKFSNTDAPNVMVQIGLPGQIGVAQISDMLFTVADVLPGCILLQINMAGLSQGDVGLWNSHFRVGGAAGSAVETKCQDFMPCKAAFLLLHLTPTTSVYIEDMWGWTADHDLDGDYTQQISTGRGALIESTRGTWLVGTAFEHNTLYQYNLVSAANLFIGMQQSETPYWQGTGGPAQAPAPWTPNAAFSDPTFANCATDGPNCRMAWFQRIVSGSNLYIFGSGFWTFFNNLGACMGINGTCQDNACEIVGNPTELNWWNLNTRGNLNLLIDDGVVLETQNNNPGSWGAVVAATLTHSGILGRLARRLRRGILS
ncbi:pectin lyase-like protein [Mollisia scopiformis]|uniref:Pectin lyase-like protein n=1 Tax=Mollisia scopiformis TaxID=149040 RepID=A0A132B3D4_MOLSC|nr:pectin lyase-like protein [Mollisia scopiformis]KUJ06906.1 pectin lyase-like protein [Mollisia scopiformis]